MSEAIHQGDVPAVTWAIVAMVAVIVVVDQLFWRPIVVWSQRFKTEETAEADQTESWVLNLLRRSRIYQRLFQERSQPRNPVAVSKPFVSPGSQPHVQEFLISGWKVIRPTLLWLLLVSLAVVVGWGLWSLVRLLLALPLHDPVTHEDWITVLLAMLASFLRTTAAVALASAWALPVGILVGLSARWSQRLQPVLQVLASFPAPMLFSLVILLMGVLGIPFTIGSIVLLLLGSQWYILFNVIAGTRAIPDDLKEAAQAYGMTPLQRWTRLYIPCVFPYLVTGLITAAGGAWNATIVAEYVQLQGETYVAFGLGSTISKATAAGQYALLCASVVSMALFVVMINRLFWKRLYRLAEERYSLNA